MRKNRERMSLRSNFLCLFRKSKKEPAHGSCKKSHFWRQIISTAERKWVISLILWIFFVATATAFCRSHSLTHSQFYNLNFSSLLIQFAHTHAEMGERDVKSQNKYSWNICARFVHTFLRRSMIDNVTVICLISMTTVSLPLSIKLSFAYFSLVRITSSFSIQDKFI